MAIPRREQFLKLLQALEKEIIKFNETSEHDRKIEIMNLLHEYNNIKDATQEVLSAIANTEGVTSSVIHKRFNLPLES